MEINERNNKLLLIYDKFQRKLSFANFLRYSERELIQLGRCTTSLWSFYSDSPSEVKKKCHTIQLI